MQTNRPQMDSAVHWWFTSCCFRGAACRGVSGAAWSSLIGDSPLWLQPGMTSSLQYIWSCCLILKLSSIWIYVDTIHRNAKTHSLAHTFYTSAVWVQTTNQVLQLSDYSHCAINICLFHLLECTLVRRYDKAHSNQFKPTEAHSSENKRPWMQIKYSSFFFRVYE